MVFGKQDAAAAPAHLTGVQGGVPRAPHRGRSFAAYLVVDTIGGALFGGDEHVHAPRVHYEKSGVGMGITVAEGDDDHHHH